MKAEDFACVVETRLGVREALAAVWEAAMTAGWEVLGDYDLSRLFAPGGGREARSIDICRPDLARPFVAAEALTALCMPCSVLVYADGAGTKLAAMRPGVVMPRLFGDASREVGGLPARVDRELKCILEAAAREDALVR